MNIFNKICAIAYELGFVLLLVLVILTPLHGAATKHLNVVETLDISRAVIAGDLSGLHIGDTVSIYRFNYSWKLPIGTARIEALQNGTAEISTDPSQMSWPLGRQGMISRSPDGNLYTSMGANVGLEAEDTLNVFRDRTPIGQAHITSVTATTSTLQISSDIADPAGLIVSEFTYENQVALFQNTFFSILEIALIVAALLGYIGTYAINRRSPFILIGERIRAISFNRDILFWVVNIIFGIPFVWFMAKMPLYLLAYTLAWVDLHLLGQTVYLLPLANTLLPYAYVLVGVLSYGYLIGKQRSPILALWRFISYKRTSTVKTVSWQRGIVMWGLHLIIVYVFAVTLLGFLNGDIAAARAIEDPYASREAFFEWSKYIIWSLTVVGCLFGYGYSILSILWGKFIRNIDFTITGWLTNGFCYPFLGVIIWQMIPSFTGPDPIITGGPAQTLMLVLGLFFNVLYMLSIWNLGTLFDLMTDKGVRTWGFYSVVRHPNYTLEVAMFFVTELIGLTAGIHWLAILMYFFLYWIRSEREDNFMGYSNPGYVPYRVQTPYKFIPGLY